MKNDRIKEISAFAKDFNNRLKLSDEELIQESNFIKINNRNKKNNLINFRKHNITPQTKSKLTFQKDIFKPLLPWIPNSMIGNYFNNFQQLNDAHIITTWEKVK